MLELLLGSEHLILNHEEDTFALVTAWADGRWGRNRLWPCLRLHHMSPIFLASLLADNNVSAKVGPRRITDAVAYHSISASLRLPGVSVDAASPFASYKPSRAPENTAPYQFEAHIDLADCKALEDLKSSYVMLGVAAGYRVCLHVRKHKEPATLGMYVGVKAISPVAGAAVPGPIARLRIEAGRSLRHYICAMNLTTGKGYHDFFAKPWEEVVCEGSPYFPEGRMSVKVTIHFLSDKHVEPVVGDLP
jgi:hypothetical protein